MDVVAARLVADLFSAYSSGDIDRVISLIGAGASPFTSNDEGNTLFHLCCTNNTDGPRILERLLTLLASASARVLFISNNDGNTPLHFACINRITECVQLLLSRSPAIINIFELTNNAGLSPLYYASKAGHIDIVTLAVSWYGLLSTDNIIKCIDDAASWQIIQLLLMKITLRDMLDTCNKHEHTQHLLRLFPMDNEYFQLSDGRTTVLHLSATSGNLEYFTTIVSIGFDINSLDSDDYTPLHRAIEYGCVSIAKYLISQPNCLCETLTKDNITPLHDAVGDPSRLSLVQGLVERGGDVNISDCNGSTALHYSCRWGHLSIVEYLTSLPQINYTKDLWGRTSLYFAAEFGQAHIVKYLVESCNHDINIDDKYGNTPVYMACIYNHLPVVEYLTGQPNCNINSNNERHPLLAATDKEHLEIVKHLIASTDCDINVREKGTWYTPLHKACYNGSLSIVEYLISKPQCNIEAIDNKLNQPLHYAACQGHKEIVSILGKKVSWYGLSKCMKSAKPEPNIMELLYDCFKDRRSLINACESGNVDIVRHFVIDKHCDVNAKERQNGYTPLHYACEKGHSEIVKILTNHPQCNIEAEGISDDRPLHKACESGNVDIVRHLVTDKHCDVNAKGGWSGYTPLHYACENGHFEIVKILTNHPQCNIEAEGNSNDIPLHKACESGNVDIVRHLVIDKYCDVNAKGLIGYTPLHYACEKGHFEIVKILTNHPQCNIEAKDNSNYRPLHKACESGNVDIVRHLVIDKHCDVHVKGMNGYTPLHYACEKGHFEIVKILTNHPQCNIEAENNSNDIPLHTACESGNVDIVRHLVIDKHCDVHVKGMNGYTPLHYACEKGHFEIVKILTNHPQCNIEAENNSNDRPLHTACESGNVDIVRHLVIDKHCDVNAKEWSGYIPLHYACKKGHFEIVKILTNHPQCNIEAENNINDRPLHKACKSGNVDIVRHLVIDKHCDVNAKGLIGYTPLHYACKKGHFEIVKILTNHPQCNIEAKDKCNDRPINLALRGKTYMNIVNYLVEVKGCNTQGITTYDRKASSYLHIHQSSGIALLRVVKCILTGPPGAGKSTLKKRLLNQSLDAGPSLSTGVIDAAVQVNSFRKLSQHNAVVTTEWKEQELDEEAVLISKKLLPTSKASDKSTRPTTTPLETSVESTGIPQPTSVNETVGLTSSFENKQKSPEGIDLSPNTSQQGNTSVSTSSPVYMEAATDTVVIDESLIMEYENVPNSPTKIVNCEEEESNEVQNSSSLVSDCVKGLSDYVMKIPDTKRREYEEKFEEAKDDNHTMLHIIDTGGQPEFHEILPALITGPAINLLVFKLTEDLRSRYEIVYRTSAGNSKPYETSLTHEEVIFRSLASIACLRQNTIGWSFDETPIEDNSEPVAFLIATHRDQVDENKVSEVNQQLRTKIENSSHLFDSDLIQFSQSEQVIFPLDTTKDEEEVKHLRSFLHKVISKKFQELKIPASWCTLSLKLRKSKRNIFKYDTCLKLAKVCGIKDKKEFKNVLWYLHHRVGIIMHYPNVAGLEDIIITDLQMVFDRITNLITKCFTFEQSGSAAVEREFRKNGRFSESQLDEMSSREKGDPLNTKKLVALLKHLYIVAGPMKAQVGQKTINYYFMPCALKPADVEREKRDGSVSPAPLLICFKCGYTPVGVFCCLVVYLLGQKTDQVLEWELSGDDQYRNRITFQVGQYHDTVTLISHATYLEVWVQQIKGSELSTSDLLSSLDKGLVTVIQSLHYTYKSKHMFGVPCTCTAVPHPAVIGFNQSATKCVNGRIVEFNEKQLYWSTKVSNNTALQTIWLY